MAPPNPLRRATRPRTRSGSTRPRTPALDEHSEDDAPDSAARQLVETMNEMSGKRTTTTRRSMRVRGEDPVSTPELQPQVRERRRRASTTGLPEVGERPSEARRVREPDATQSAASTPGEGRPAITRTGAPGRPPKNKSPAKLKRRTTGPSIPKPRREQDVYDWEVEEEVEQDPPVAPASEDDDVPRGTAAPAPAKVRQLGRKKAVDRSPLKGQGVVNTDVPGVNLSNNESPVRTQRRQPRKASAQPRDPRAGAAASHSIDDRQVAEHDVGETSDQEVDDDEQKDEQARINGHEDVGDEATDRLPLIRGMETEAHLHGCQEYWIDLFLAEQKFRPSRADRPSSAVAKDMYESIVELWLQVKERRFDAAAVTKTIETLEVKLREIREVGSMPSESGVRQNTRRESQKRVGDLYQIIIPRLVRTTKFVLRAVRPTEDTSLHDARPLMRLLELTRRTVERARTWQPRPSSLDGEMILSTTHSSIGGSIKSILHEYNSHYKAIERRQEAQRAHLAEQERIRRSEEVTREYEQAQYRRRKQLEDKARAQVREAARKRQEEAERLARIRAERDARREAQRAAARSATDMRGFFTQSIPQPLSRQAVIDIDDLDDNGHLRASPQQTWSNGARPVPRHSGTGVRAAVAEWSKDEMSALIMDLQRETGEDRFAIIAENLNRRVSDVVERAIRLKMELTPMMESLPNEEWRWLTSVHA
ncbi:uncharacterized protein AB675_7217 [Cyphellophora attinorum]|uniref:Uncharacterized protein n=1 Tax=Cyphellophora attinorum TaxID=1664694 RepID=A0A0N1H301_9EURO|nr:uncharacterized protein AB675_7217 [Phialophora attinorum]KPI35034.1 hypothetical protein AB675_7217 [Phialophora attinorum]